MHFLQLLHFCDRAYRQSLGSGMALVDADVCAVKYSILLSHWSVQLCCAAVGGLVQMPVKAVTPCVCTHIFLHDDHFLFVCSYVCLYLSVCSYALYCLNGQFPQVSCPLIVILDIDNFGLSLFSKQCALSFPAIMKHFWACLILCLLASHSPFILKQPPPFPRAYLEVPTGVFLWVFYGKVCDYCAGCASGLCSGLCNFCCCAKGFEDYWKISLEQTDWTRYVPREVKKVLVSDIIPPPPIFWLL